MKKNKHKLYCSHFPTCLACPLLGENNISHQIIQPLQELAQQNKLPNIQIIEGQKKHYRYRSRLATRGRYQSPKIGLFQKNSHKIVDIPNCPVHHPTINKIVATLKTIIYQEKIPLYQEYNHQGLLRYLQIVTERQSLSSQIVLVGNTQNYQSLQIIADKLQEKLKNSIHSIWFNGNTSNKNNILGDTWHLYYGNETISEIINNSTVLFPPGAFGQSNLNLADKIIQTITSWVFHHAHIVEFYAGCGSIGLGLLKNAQSYQFNEISPQSLHGLKLSLKLQTQINQNKISIHEGIAGSFSNLIKNADIVIVDPPRKGLDPPILQQLIKTPPQRFIYLSCGLNSFLKETQILLDSKKFTLKKIQPFNLFPYTNHIETLALFEHIIP